MAEPVRRLAAGADRIGRPGGLVIEVVGRAGARTVVRIAGRLDARTLLLGKPGLRGELLVLDLLNGSFERLRLARG